MARNTRTGAMLESIMGPPLKMGGYTFSTQVKIGTRPGGRKHYADVIAEKDGRRIIVSVKNQQVGGTAEEKVPWEVICQMHAVKEYGYDKAYIVLGGIGWTLRDFYVGGGLLQYIPHRPQVEIVTLEQFLAIASKGKL
jgi:hypothetical protein